MMRKSLMLCVCVAAIGAWSANATAGGCKGCAEIQKAGEGFCDHCGAGKIFGLRLASKAIYDKLAGSAEKVEELEHSPCPGCKSAAEHDGSCEHCKTYVAHGKAYQIVAVYAMAKGTPVSSPKVAKMMKSCPGCKEHAADSGFCSGCSVGFVGGRAFSTKADYKAAKQAHKIIAAAVDDAGHCETCGLARLTDGTCEHCKVKFENGIPTKG